MSTTTTELNLETILYAKKGAIAYVTLNRPKVLNALNKRTWEDLKAAFEDAQDDAAVRGVILTRAGRGFDHARRDNPEADFFQCAARGEVLTRGGEQGSGNQPDRRLVTRSLFVRPLRGNRRQKGRHAGISAKARRTIPGPLNKKGSIYGNSKHKSN